MPFFSQIGLVIYYKQILQQDEMIYEQKKIIYVKE